MRQFKHICLIVPLTLWLCIIVGCRHEIPDLSLPVERCSDMPISLTAAACFSYEGKGYVFGGRKANGQHNNQLYCYDPISDEWITVNTPLSPRVRPRAVVVGKHVYIGLGMNGTLHIDSSYLNDWWRWTPDCNHWERMSDYTSSRPVGPVLTTDEKYIYSAYGGRRNFERCIFRYEVATDTWIQLADGVERMATYPPRAHSVAGAMCKGRLFLGTGHFGTSQDFWVEAEIIQDSIIWKPCTPFPTARHNAVGISDDQYIYIGGGRRSGGTVTNGQMYDDVFCYSPTEDSWKKIGQLPDGARENMIAWIINGTLYIGLGSDKNNIPCQQLYRIKL